MIKIYNAENDMEAQHLCSLLENAGISSYLREASSGEYMKISMGFHIYGVDLFVNEKDASKAKEIVQNAIQDKNRVYHDKIIAKIPWYKNRTIIARITLGLVVLSGVIVIICNL